MSISTFSRHCESASEQGASTSLGSSQVTAPVGWFDDPLGRFEGRYFDGGQWTNQVSDNGVLRLDPRWETSSPAPSTSPAKESAGTTERTRNGERRGQYDRRQIMMKVDVDRRTGDRRDG